MGRRVVAIINPVSGRRNMLPVVRRIGRLLQDGGGEMQLEVTTRAGHATDLASQAALTADAVLAVGGDGTVCEVVNGLIGRNIPIVILRTGTENLLAGELKMPTEPEQVARTLLRGRPFPCDVGMVNGQCFLAVVGVGFDAECVARMSQLRKGHITRWDYFWPIWRTFWAHRFPVIRIEADNEVVFDGPGLAIIGGIGQYSAGMRILRHARCDDGLLDLCVLPCRSKPALLGHAGRVFLGRHLDKARVLYRQCREICVSSDEKVPIEVDGEPGGFLPAVATVLPSGTTFLQDDESKVATN